MNRARLFRLTAAAAVLFAAFSAGAADYNELGGWYGVTAEPKRFFHAREIGGVWWIVDPAGWGFLSKGVNHVSHVADFSPALGYSPYERAVEKKYGDPSAWADATAERLRSWNFNTVGAWSSESMFRRRIPYTVMLNMAAKAGADWEKGVFPDVYSKDFRWAVFKTARQECRPRREDIFLLGYFTDNELRWGPDWRKDASLLLDYLALPQGSPGLSKAYDFLGSRHGNAAALGEAWNIKIETFENIADLESLPQSRARLADEEAFLEQLAAKYFSTCREAILEADPNHMILGARFAGKAPEPVLRAMRDHVDIVSYNTYNQTPPEAALRRVHEITGKPVMIAEFSFKAMDSGLPNTKGAGEPVAAQSDRARLFASFVTELVKLPYIVGYHWFEYADEPAEGRFDGENGNYGLVNINDEPWETLTAEMTRTNRRVEAIHAASAPAGGAGGDDR